MTVGSIFKAWSSMSQILLSVGMNIRSERVSFSFIGLRAMLSSAAYGPRISCPHGMTISCFGAADLHDELHLPTDHVAVGANPLFSRIGQGVKPQNLALQGFDRAVRQFGYRFVAPSLEGLLHVDADSQVVASFVLDLLDERVYVADVAPAEIDGIPRLLG